MKFNILFKFLIIILFIELTYSKKCYIKNKNNNKIKVKLIKNKKNANSKYNENSSLIDKHSTSILPSTTNKFLKYSSNNSITNESLPTSTEVNIDKYEIEGFSTEEDSLEEDSVEEFSSVHTSANEDLPTSTEIENENLSSTTTSADEISETIIPIKQNICNDVVTINNSNFITVYFKETLMYNKCILSDFYFIKENSSITTIMYCGKIYLNNDVQKYNIKINRNKSIIFGPSILEIEKVYKVYMTNKGEKTLCMNNNRKNNLDYKIEDAEEYIQLNSKSESKITLINKIDEIFMKNCSNEVSFNAIPALISSLEDDLCIDEDHILKIKYLFNNKDENNNNNASTPTFTITPEATSSSVNNYCDKSNKDLKYSEIKNKTFNFEGYVLYNKNTCKLNLVSSGPSNYYTLNPYNQKVQVNGFIECIYFDDEGNKSTYTKKVRIESLNGARKFKIISDVNPYADYTFFESFKYTHTSTVSNNDAIKDFTKGKFSMYNYITYYYDEEMKEKIGSIRSTWNYNVFVGEDVWITC